MQAIFGFIIHPMELGLIWVALTTGSAAIAIVLFTIAVRLVLSPLQITQLRNARAMQRVQPLVKDLQKKHGKDKQALSQATMALYKEHRVNPLLGCLPTLLQFPILLALYYALSHLGLSPRGYPTAVSFVGTVCNGVAVHGWSQWFDVCMRSAVSRARLPMCGNSSTPTFCGSVVALVIPIPTTSCRFWPVRRSGFSRA